MWNEEIETLSAKALNRLESERLQEQLPYNFTTSPFYRAKFEAANVNPEEIRSREDLTRLPFMEKSELATSQPAAIYDAVGPSPIREPRAQLPPRQREPGPASPPCPAAGEDRPWPSRG